ncbi:MAG TPA: chitin-binding protein [Actinobacteria bacterium]|nr:chitin-binding protein [Actinomycetota bacterium]
MSENRSVVVTGGTRGIGQGLAREFLKRGCRVTITGTSQSSIDRGLAALGGESATLTGAVCDIASRDQVQGVWDHAVAKFGRVDIWVNNAGMSLPRKPLPEIPADDIQKIVNTNLVGVFNGDAVAMKGMLAQGSGYIWNMEGFGSNGQASSGLGPYGATKRALNYLTKVLIKELKGTGVGMGYLSPGIVVTDLLVQDYEDDQKQWEKVQKTFNILGDTVETVTPYLAEGVLKTDKNGARVAWLTTGKAAGRFATAGFRKKRNLFDGIDPRKGVTGSLSA